MLSLRGKVSACVTSRAKRALSKLKSKSVTHFPSRKMGSIVLTESPLEANFCYYLEFDDDVEYYESQPLGFYYQHANKTHTFTPDFEVFIKSSSYYYEVQSNTQADRSEQYLEYFNAAREQADRLGKDLILISENWIQRSSQLHNIRHIYRCMSVNYYYELLCRVKTKLAQGKSS